MQLAGEARPASRGGFFPVPVAVAVLPVVLLQLRAPEPAPSLLPFPGFLHGPWAASEPGAWLPSR